MSDKFKNYEELVEYLADLPTTWYPDLIRRMIIFALKKKIFKKGGPARLAQKTEDDWRNDD